MRRLEDGDISAAWEEIVVRLTDFGEEPDPAATPSQLAAHVDDAMKPLAAVYSRSVYGGPVELSKAQADTARLTRDSPVDLVKAFEDLIAISDHDG